MIWLKIFHRNTVQVAKLEKPWVFKFHSTFLFFTLIGVYVSVCACVVIYGPAEANCVLLD